MDSIFVVGNHVWLVLEEARTASRESREPIRQFVRVSDNTFRFEEVISKT